MSNLFSHRSNEQELMDNLQAGGELMNQSLRELEFINKWLGGNLATINAVNKLIKNNKHKTWRIIDIGCGGGDILKLIAIWARKKSIAVELTGIDANMHVVNYAKKNTADFPEISFKTLNILSADFKSVECDIITATLFTHHFTNKELVTLFTQFRKQARLGIAINDLHRHWFAYHSINLLTVLFSKSAMVKNDAGVSVLRAFQKKELMEILKAAGIHHFSIKWFWAFRWQIIARF